MINAKYSKAILNALFHTSGSSSVTPEQDKQSLISQRVPWVAYVEDPSDQKALDDALDYMKDQAIAKFEADKNTKGDNYDQYLSLREIVNESVWYTTATVTFDHTYTLYGSSATAETTLEHWYIYKKSSESASYPSKAYLALYTTMPDSSGAGYVEPTTTLSEDGTEIATTYMRVDLHEGIITGEVALNHAIRDEQTGAASIDNCDPIVYPEVFGGDWGTIVGFGVHEIQSAGTGDAPVFWGRVNPAIASRENYVPLFRVGNFKVTLQ